VRRPSLPLWLAVAAILTRAAPVVLSLAVNGHVNMATEIDSQQYLQLGSSLAWSGAFARDGGFEIIRTPLYPLLLVPGIWLGWPVTVAVVAQIAASVLVLALLFDTALIVTGSRRVAVCAAVIFLLEPCQPMVSIMLMPDALLTGLVTLLLWLAVQYRPQRSPRRHIVVMGIVAAACAYAKPPGYIFGLVLVIGLAIAWWRRTTRRALVSEFALLLTVNFLLMTAWNARNFVTTGYPGFSTQFERAAFVGWPAALVSHRTGEDYDTVRKRMGTTGGATEAPSIRAARKVGWPILLRGLPEYLWIHVRGSLTTLMDPGVSGWLLIAGHDPGSTHVGKNFKAHGIGAGLRSMLAAPPEALLLSIVFTLWPLACVALWFVALWKGPRDPWLLAVSACLVMFLFIVGGSYSHCRYRAPVVPILSVLAALGLSRLHWVCNLSRRPAV
jgi:4-amino-4-deoxy-L-arabinose transferase-like glycosyltransferase